VTADSLSICVFCASASGLEEVYLDSARLLGKEIGRRGYRLVYGGGNVGLMREVAISVQDAGGEVFGAIPRSLVERELAYGPADELVVTETLRERKAEMDNRADAFVALPGGFGTMEELLEVLTLRQLNLHDRPIVLVNVNGFWDPFLAMVREMTAQGFAREGEGALFVVAATAEEAVEMVESSAGDDGRRRPPPSDALAEDWTAEPA
jgi:cytokinin riboside 5'-monophosphate phosphoribohydrolase